METLDIKPKKYYPNILQSIGLLAIYLVATVGVTLLLMLFMDPMSGVGLFLAYTISMAITISAGFALRGNSKLSLNSVSVGIIVIGSILCIVSHVAIDPIVSLFPVPNFLSEMMEGIYKNPIASIALIAFAAPIAEEIIFRGIILDGLLKNYSPLRSIILSSLFFALIHGNVAQVLGAFVMGLFMGWIYWRTNSLYPSLIFHFVNNLLASVAVFMTPKEEIDKNLVDVIGSPQLYYLLVFISIIICVGGVLFIQHRYFKFNKSNELLADGISDEH